MMILALWVQATTMEATTVYVGFTGGFTADGSEPASYDPVFDADGDRFVIAVPTTASNRVVGIDPKVLGGLSHVKTVALATDKDTAVVQSAGKTIKAIATVI